MTRDPLWGDDSSTPKTPRSGTARIAAASRLELDLEDPNMLAEFLEHVAMVVRSRRRIVLIVE